MTEGGGKNYLNSNNNNVIIENKNLDENISSRCCLMYNIFYNIF